MNRKQEADLPLQAAYRAARLDPLRVARTPGRRSIFALVWGAVRLPGAHVVVGFGGFGGFGLREHMMQGKSRQGHVNQGSWAINALPNVKSR